MYDIEETLRSELHDVAGGLHVPPLPALPEEAPRRRWLPALAAAAAVLVVVGVVAVVASSRDGEQPDPAPPSPTMSESPTQAVDEIPTTAPRAPYLLNLELYVGGEKVPGDWWSVRSGGDVWLAQRSDYTWWWGRGTDAQAISVYNEIAPAISPAGTYIAYITDQGGPVLTGFDTAPDGEGLGGVQVDPGDPSISSLAHPAAVTDDGRVVVQGGGRSLLWLPLVDNSVVDLAETAPGQIVTDSTAAGLLVTNAEESEYYLAEISDAGELTRTADLPQVQGLEVSPGAVRMAWTPVGTLGGEVTEIGRLELGTVDGSEHATVQGPEGSSFQVQQWRWEDDVHLIATVSTEPDAQGFTQDRLARCSVDRCVLIHAH